MKRHFKDALDQTSSTMQTEFYLKPKDFKYFNIEVYIREFYTQ